MRPSRCDDRASVNAPRVRFQLSARHRAGEEGATYFVRWPVAGGGEEFLECHLRKGSGTDARHCLAIYFFWDQAGEQVVVGWLPGHLENRMT